MKFYPVYFLILLWLFLVPMQADTIEAITTPDLGGIAGFGFSPFYNRAELGDNWDPKATRIISLFFGKPLKPWLESRLELQYLDRKQVRTLEHPEPYVFETDVKVETELLRLPVSLLLITKPTKSKLRCYLEGGLSVANPTRGRMKSVQHYNTE